MWGKGRKGLSLGVSDESVRSETDVKDRNVVSLNQNLKN